MSQPIARDATGWSTLDEIAAAIKSADYPAAIAGAHSRVPGAGNPEARVMFIGEAPGFHEDREGKPFVGAAGQFLDEMLASIGLARSDVFITNLVHTRPPENRDPTPEEIEAAWPYLAAQIQLMAPEVIVLLGRHSANRFLPGESGISRIHGRVFRRPNPATDEPEQWFLPLYHPAAGLHNEALRDTIRSDFRELGKLVTVLDRLKAAGEKKSITKPE